MNKFARNVVLTLSLLVLGSLELGCSTTSGNTPNPSPIPTMSPEVHKEPPNDQNWITPGMVKVGNFHPGAQAEWFITVHNGQDTEILFDVTYKHPDHVGEGFVKPTEEVQDWVIIADTTPLLAPFETRTISILLDMPESATAPGDGWEFWISVIDASQAGFVKTELCSRWLITMR